MHQIQPFPSRPSHSTPENAAPKLNIQDVKAIIRNLAKQEDPRVAQAAVASFLATPADYTVEEHASVASYILDHHHLYTLEQRIDAANYTIDHLKNYSDIEIELVIQSARDLITSPERHPTDDYVYASKLIARYSVNYEDTHKKLAVWHISQNTELYNDNERDWATAILVAAYKK
jgi:hypothetical protein